VYLSVLLGMASLSCECVRICVDEVLTGQELLDYVSEYVEVRYVRAACRQGDDDVDHNSLLHQIRLTNIGLHQVNSPQLPNPPRQRGKLSSSFYPMSIGQFLHF